uniref:Uncharacterized protein n=1 Tax=Strigamia maritima TaxID=126957 RepID=T1JLH3_STRMM
FAVGAPYEDDNGVVYIYHGDIENGITFDLAQKLVAKAINPALKGFGISIAKGKDIDRNSYPDIAIGSYESGHAVILRTLPSVVIHASVKSSPTKLSITSFPCKLNGHDVGCVNISTCIRYESPRKLPFVEVETKLSFDAIVKDNSKRGFFYVNKVENVAINRKQRLQGRHEICNTHQAFLKPNIKNYLTPIEILYEFKLPEQAKDNFCASCPVLSPRSKSSISHLIYFLNGCGDDELCYSDLHLQATVTGQQRPEIWTGLNKTISFDISVSNSAEAAFLSELNVTVPSWSSFVRQPTICNDITSTNTHHFLICDIGNPLPTNEKISLQLYLNIEAPPIDLRELTVQFQATTGSMEKSELLHDNNIVITIPAKLTADITVYGSTPNEYISYANMTNTDNAIFYFTHVY